MRWFIALVGVGILLFAPAVVQCQDLSMQEQTWIGGGTEGYNDNWAPDGNLSGSGVGGPALDLPEPSTFSLMAIAVVSYFFLRGRSAKR